MARRGSHQRPHVRRSKKGKKFIAGRGSRTRYTRTVWKPKINNVCYTTRSSIRRKIPVVREEIKNAKSVSPQSVKEIEDLLTNKNVLKGIATGLTIVTGNPLPLLLYKIYSIGDSSYRLIQEIQSKEIDKELYLLKQIAGSNTTLYNRKLGEVSMNLTNSFISSGVIPRIVSSTGWDTNTVNSIFQATIEGALCMGLENLPGAVLDAVW